MTQPGRGLEFGFFPAPYAAAHEDLLRQVQLAEDLGYDLIGIQDHPYQRRFLDTFTLLPWLAARTERIRLFPDVAHLPLRPPAMLAKAMASLDVLSRGRSELGIGAGAFSDASQAMGAPARSGLQALAALEEAITIIRRFWEAPEQGIHHAGVHYRLGGVKAGPAPAHDIGIWVGGGGPKMLELIARMGDGWIAPAARYLSGPGELLAKQSQLDRAAEAQGRDPSAIRRAYAGSGVISDRPADEDGTGTVTQWIEHLESLAAEGFDTFIFWPEDVTDEQLHAFAEIAGTLRRTVGRSTVAGTG
jgi:alkanesulfonate monooxygenase SsuD/methylene tetrahydromethanopterin reductase-like flavin-dependent oxidoreductase (luciferase family)